MSESEEIQLPTAVEIATARLAEIEKLGTATADAAAEKQRVLSQEMLLARSLGDHKRAAELFKELHKEHLEENTARSPQTDLPAQYRY